MRENLRGKTFMAPHKTVSINGRDYDAVTGLPIEAIEVTAPDKTPISAKKSAPAAPAKPAAPKTARGTTNSAVAHSTLQRSQTLHRRATKKPAVPNKPVTKRNAPGRHMDIAKSATVSRFGAATPRPAASSAAATAKYAPAPTVSKPAPQPDKPAQVHPVAERALKRSAAAAKKAQVKAAPKTAKQVKEAQITKALSAPIEKAAPKPKKDRKKLTRFIIIGAIIVIVLGGLYAAWRLIPTISVSIAAAQADIAASYPEYTPDGYSLSQPVTFSDGEVDLKFVSNSSDNYYTIIQQRSSWDSSAVLDNVVTPKAGANYVTTKERGLTIYTYGSNAAWVNGGILYTIESKAPLSGDQVRRIATSL
jgi:hypothetical protein